MKRIIRKINALLAPLGIDLILFVRSLRALLPFFRDYRNFRQQLAAGNNPLPVGPLYPCLLDRYAEGGSASGHYFHQDLLVARRIHAAQPLRHLDVGSRVDGFVAHVAAFRHIEVMDIRPVYAAIPNITFVQADLMKPLPDELVGCCDSLSCLHALEHFGLGLYGDPIAPDGHLRGFDNLCLLVNPGGTLYLSVPMGELRVEFNAHRVFSVAYLRDLVSSRFRIERFSYVDDRGDLHEDVELADEPVKGNFGCRYGCAILELVRTGDQ